MSRLTTKRDDADRSEKELFEESLREHGQLAHAESEELPPGATHEETTDETGERTVRRKRMSAF
ncbi:hypothetical protein AFM11_31805 [Mycolicibacterium wolinskyi]|uniref:Uncharacterized protein n=1 Tax=Mycolicibacterium wolinskyi TaxID=59750 RepID=A0A132PCV9_9MYCO|nr:hypothetical protein AFM11_31805 [Mycolicibacterium wolinskyi]